MNNNFDVIVVGGGIYGSVCAYFLGQHHRVLLVERERIGSAGATSYSRGIVRAYDPDPALAEVSLRGAIELDQWEERGYPGFNPYRSTGFLYLLPETGAQAIRQFAERYDSPEYPIHLLRPAEVSRRFPWLRPDPDRIGVFEARGGYGDPRLTATNFAEGFRTRGGQVYENCEVRGFEALSDGRWKVQLPLGSVRASVVLFTTGAYTKRFFPDLPVFTRSISLTQVSDPAGLVQLPLIDEGVETYYRPGDGASFYAGSQVYARTELHRDLAAHKAAEHEDSMRRIELLMKESRSHRALNYLKGFDAYTVDKKPIVQFLEEYPGVYLAAGFSGRGYKCALSLGQQIAQQIRQRLGSLATAPEIKWRLSLKDQFV